MRPAFTSPSGLSTSTYKQPSYFLEPLVKASNAAHPKQKAVWGSALNECAPDRNIPILLRAWTENDGCHLQEKERRGTRAIFFQEKYHSWYPGRAKSWLGPFRHYVCHWCWTTHPERRRYYCKTFWWTMRIFILRYLNPLALLSKPGMRQTKNCSEFELPMPKWVIWAQRSTPAGQPQTCWMGKKPAFETNFVQGQARYLYFPYFFTTLPVPGSTRRSLEGRASEEILGCIGMFHT